MSKWLMNGDVYESAYDVAEEIADNVGDDWFEEQIYHDYGDDVEICGYYFDIIDTLKSVSWQHYESICESYRNKLFNHLQHRVSMMTRGNMIDVLGYEIKCLSDGGDE